METRAADRVWVQFLVPQLKVFLVVGTCSLIVIRDGHQPNSKGLYKGGMTIPNIATFDHGTHVSIENPFES